MSIVTEIYTRKPFEIEAAQVTDQNMVAVAEWCGGTLEKAPSGKHFIKVDVLRPLDDKQTRAFPGDWVLRVKRSFKVYTDKAFNHCFDKGTLEDNYRPSTAQSMVPFPPAYPKPSTR